MNALKCEIRDNSDIKKNERVYFTCHPDDFERYFEEIKEELHKYRDCAVYYNEDLVSPWDEEEMALQFSQMQLFVIPITYQFLFEENRAREVEFAYAVEHHIPVLPLMQESGLAPAFNAICGNLQFLDKHSTDKTEIPYEEKLKKYLQSVLIGDEMAEKIRAAFDAYIFLSYRKKDRKYAQELMRLIHKNEFCRDIAIWYDEFLTPGEEFNRAIQEAMEKSSLFAMVVTPNLLEEPNYVMDEEYPAAVKLNKKILPAEMIETDKAQLKKKYQNLPEVPSAEQTDILSEMLLKHLHGIAIRENDADPQHLFFIGLAYLNGIDVEVNNKRAARLIKKAAAAELPEAMEKLASMYETGEGIPWDYEQGVEWRKKVIDYYKKIYDSEPTKENAQQYFEKLCDLKYSHQILGIQQEKERQVADEIVQFCLEANKSFDFRSPLALSYHIRAGIKERGFETKEKYEREISFYKKELKIGKELERENKIEAAKRCLEGASWGLSIAYNNLSTMLQCQGELEEAIFYRKKNLQFEKQHAEERNTREAWWELAESYDRMGGMMQEAEQPEKAVFYCRKALLIHKRLAKEEKTNQTKRLLASGYFNFGSMMAEVGRLDEAKKYFKEGLKLDIQLADATALDLSGLSTWCILADRYKNIGELMETAGKTEDAEYCYKKRLETIKKWIDKTGDESAWTEWWFYDLDMGYRAKKNDKLEEAKEFYEHGLKISKEQAERTKDTEAWRSVSINYDHLEKLAEEMGNYQKAKFYYEESCKIKKKLEAES